MRVSVAYCSSKRCCLASLQGFGFCDFENAEGAQRALRLLNGFAIDGKELLVKPNKATQAYLDWYTAQKEEKAKEAPGTDESNPEAAPAEEAELQDPAIKQELMNMTGKRLQSLGK